MKNLTSAENTVLKTKTTISVLGIALIYAFIALGGPITFAALAEASTTSSSQIAEVDSPEELITKIDNESNKSLTNGDYTNQEALKVSWGEVDGAQTYKLYTWNSNANKSVKLLESSSVPTDAKKTTINGLGSDYDLTLGDGTYYWAVSAMDNKGNESSVSKTFSVRLDTTAPVISVSSPLSFEGIIGKTLNIYGSIRETNLANYNFLIKNSADIVLVYSPALSYESTSNKLATIDLIGWESGRYEVSFMAIDLAGNKTVTDINRGASFEVINKGTSDNSIPPAIEVVLPSESVKPVRQTLVVIQSNDQSSAAMSEAGAQVLGASSTANKKTAKSHPIDRVMFSSTDKDLNKSVLSANTLIDNWIYALPLIILMMAFTTNRPKRNR